MSRTIKHIVVVMVFWYLIVGLSSAFAVEPRDIVRLKQAGVSDSLLKEIIRSDAIARALISVDEILEMKEVNIGDDVILTILEQGSAPVPELDREDAADRALERGIKRQEMRLEVQRKEFDILVEYISALIGNPEIIKLVHEGKIASADYARIVKYLKQYARNEDTREYDYGGDINIDIKKTDK
ncbi:MAG: hypothetical protein JRJ77_05860 [Deltaproteobacteria bacterium]|nr:hypothetical protein [Deltaproteobacteria bacterium]MBW2341810.1 hypothetical protein [Deltaproteobacteria bacterium]